MNTSELREQELYMEEDDRYERPIYIGPRPGFSDTMKRLIRIIMFYSEPKK